MNKNLPDMSEEQLDRIALTVLQSTVLKDREIEEIAEAPQIWWQIQSRIAAEKERREKRRFFGWQWMPVGALAILLAASAAIWFFNPKQMTEIAAAGDEQIVNTQEQKTAPEIKSEYAPNILPVVEKTKNSPAKIYKATAETALPKKFIRAKTVPLQLAKTNSVNPKKTEIATEFIRLSYSSAAESGQILRVKVPRSMMVSLGVTTKVERASELINAEVVVGDDGAARAIRFLANE